MARLKGFEKLANIDEALFTFFEELEIKRLEAERIPINVAFGRVTAEDTVAKNSLPPFYRSAVDGYAVRAKDTFEASQFSPKILKITKSGVNEREAEQIWTGNQLPKGTDAVIMLEYTKKIRGEIEVWISVTPGENVSQKGEDIKKGEIAVRAGTRLRPQHLGLLAALGVTHINVVRKPKVVVLSTGNELVELGREAKPNQIIDSNRLVLSNMCRELGAEPLDFGIAKDDMEEISTRIREGLKDSDVVVTTGGTSVGHYDLVPTVVNQIGAPGVVVHGIAMRPGMPTALAVLNGKPVLILSGNPVAAMIGFEVFARPLFLKMLGLKGEPRPLLKARLTRKVASVLGRRVFLRVKVFEKGDDFLAEPVRIKGSGSFSTMTKANGYVVIPEDREGLEKGESIMVHLFDKIEGVQYV